MEREGRARLPDRVAHGGNTDDYSGTRIAANGNQFMIDATVWNLLDE